MKFQTVNHGLVDVDNNLDHKLSLILETFFLFVHVVVLDDTIFFRRYAHLFLILYWTYWMEECVGMRDII